MSNGFNDYINNMIITNSRSVIRYRECARDKTYDYSTRLMYDRFVIGCEDRIISMANLIMARLEGTSLFHSNN